MKLAFQGWRETINAPCVDGEKCKVRGKVKPHKSLSDQVTLTQETRVLALGIDM